jgi:hypothetical protein
MAVNYHFIAMAPYKTETNTTVIYCHIITLEKENTTVNYGGMIITLTPVANFMKLFQLLFMLLSAHCLKF